MLPYLMALVISWVVSLLSAMAGETFCRLLIT